jgi:hypothetical protein
VSGSAARAGNGEVSYIVLPNLTRQNREATITVTGATHKVSQRGLSGEDDDDDDDDDDDERDVEVRGAVSGLSGTCPNLTFVVRGTLIRTNNNTEFRKGSCGELENRMDVEVRGRRQSDGSIVARRVELKD